jgi:heat shock protein HspQ
LTEFKQLPFLIDLWDDESHTVHDGVLKGFASCGRRLYEWLPIMEPVIGPTFMRQIFAELKEVEASKIWNTEALNLLVPGQLIEHRRNGYRGVIVDVDYYCMADEQWYTSNPSQPTRIQPWYHVLVDNSDAVTYAAESSLVVDDMKNPVQHPYLFHFFNAYQGGAYTRNNRPWPRDEEF